MSIVSNEKLLEDQKADILAKGIIGFSQQSYGNISIFDLENTYGISRYKLFEFYVGKKEFYLHCLDVSLGKVFKEDEKHSSGDLYGAAMFAIDNKLERLSQYVNELRFIQMAARETHCEVFKDKQEIINKHCACTPFAAMDIIAKRAKSLDFSDPCGVIVSKALSEYINTVINKFLLQYQGNADNFISGSKSLKDEVCHYVDYMLFNLVKSENSEKIS